MTATMAPGETAVLQVGYRSQGLSSWRYRLGEGIAQVRDFSLVMTTNFKEVDFADDTLSPTTKEAQSGGWRLTWQYSNLIAGFQIGMTMPEKLQPGPLAGQISYFAPVSLFFFFFLMFLGMIRSWQVKTRVSVARFRAAFPPSSCSLMA